MPETDRQRAEGPEAGEQTAAPYPEMGAAEMSAAVGGELAEMSAALGERSARRNHEGAGPFVSTRRQKAAAETR